MVVRAPRTLIALLATVAAWGSAATANGERWDRTLAEVREAFPDVPHLTTRQLAEMRSRGEPVLLLDAREPEEFQVSHIDGAVRATTVRHRAERHPSRQPATDRGRVLLGRLPLFALVSRLKARGVENVFNLEGSLFQWANEGRPLARADEPATLVHPYDDDWGELLNEALRAE